LERGLANRRPLIQVVAASLYAACREADVPATLQDVAAASGVGKIQLARCYRLMVSRLDLRIPVADPAECLTSVASRAKVDPEVEANAREILSRAAKAGITGGVCPTGLAASALYLASLLEGQRLTQSVVAEAAGVRDATVRKEYRRLSKVLGAEAKGSRRRSRHQSELEASPSGGVEVLARFPS